MIAIEQIIRDEIADKIPSAPYTTRIKSLSPLYRLMHLTTYYELTGRGIEAPDFFALFAQALEIYSRSSAAALKIIILPEDIIIITEEQQKTNHAQILSLHHQDSVDKAAQIAATLLQKLNT